MAKHCIFEHFFSFVNQNRAKPWVIVTLHLRLRQAKEALERDEKNGGTKPADLYAGSLVFMHEHPDMFALLGLRWCFKSLLKVP